MFIISDQLTGSDWCDSIILYWLYYKQNLVNCVGDVSLTKISLASAEHVPANLNPIAKQDPATMNKYDWL